MKQVLQSYRTGEVEVADVPAPRAPRGGLLVRTSASLVSAGTERMVMELAKKSVAGKALERPDLVKKVTDKIAKDGVIMTAKAVVARLDQPIPLGYSCCGVVVDRGSGAESLALGTRVACAGAKLANHAEFNAVPRNLCVTVPEGVSDEAAAFVTVGAIALQGVRTAELTLGERVAVIGLGLIGQLVVQLCKAQGCKVLGIDLDPMKVDLATAHGADEAVLRGGPLEETVARLTDGRGVDAVIICAATDSDDPIVLAGEISRDRGRVVVVGAVPMNVPRRPYYDKELQLLQSRSYGPGRYDPVYEEQGVDYPFGYVRWTEGRNMEAFLEQCATGRVKVESLVTHRFPITEAERAYRVISGEARESFVGVVLTYGSSEHGGEPARTLEVARSAPTRPISWPRVSVIGAGNFASGVLVPELARFKGIRLHTIVSARGISARHVAQKYGFAECSTDDAAALTDPRADAVVIATRHDLHAEQAARALDSGKAVLLEKPAAIDRTGLARLIEAARPAGRLLLVDFNRRFAPATQALKTFFVQRSQPMVIHYRVNAGVIPGDSWIHDPAVGGGRLIGEACHFIDWCQAVCDAEVQRVYAESVGGAGGAFRQDDQVTIVLRLSDGSTAAITYTAGGDPSLPKERIEVHCGGASGFIEDFLWFEGTREGRTKRSRTLVKDKGHRATIEAFFRALSARSGSPISLRSMVTTTVTTFAALESLGTGRSIEVSGEVEALLEGRG